MARYQELFISLPDGYRAYARFWAAASARGAVLYHHGIQSHCGWYEASAERIADAGFAVLQVDRRGSGRNQQDRGHADSQEQLIADAHAARDELARRTQLKDHHVVGISWGGKLAVAAYVSDPSHVSSLTLVTPGLFPLVGVSPGEKARIGFAMLYEQRKSFDIPLDDPEFFTTEEPWKSFVATDPLTLRQCTAGFYLASRRMDKTVARLAGAPSVPLHLFIAGAERIVDNEQTEAFVKALEWPHAKVTRYPKARHSLEFEADREDYFRELTDFLGSGQ